MPYGDIWPNAIRNGLRIRWSAVRIGPGALINRRFGGVAGRKRHTLCPSVKEPQRQLRDGRFRDRLHFGRRHDVPHVRLFVGVGRDPSLHTLRAEAFGYATETKVVTFVQDIELSLALEQAKATRAA